jgi:hypothetical protein
LGALAQSGHDKLTLVADPAVESLGSWLEQLLAESTGKHGTGIVPVDLEPLAASPDAYERDRVFVQIALAGSSGVGAADAVLASLEAAGQPVIRIELDEPLDIAGEFVRWEVATAIAGAVLGIDPFDQPNVEEAKQLTRDVLAGASGDGSDRATASGGGDALRIDTDGAASAGELRRHLERRQPNAYLAIQAFIAPTEARTDAFARIRGLLRDTTRCATTAGYGPRFLHSTGQLHKGGPPTGWFLQLTSDHPQDLRIPGWPYTFGQLIDAQAAGDFAAIRSHDLPILRVHLGPDPDAGLAALERALAEAVGAKTEA